MRLAEWFDTEPAVPQTDEEALAWFDVSRPPLLARTLKGMYECYRGEGLSVASALRATLKRHAEICEEG